MIQQIFHPWFLVDFKVGYGVDQPDPILGSRVHEPLRHMRNDQLGTGYVDIRYNILPPWSPTPI